MAAKVMNFNIVLCRVHNVCRSFIRGHFNKKKGKNGAKLSQEEINNLSTEELLSYI